jgi:hypothetical protein
MTEGWVIEADNISSRTVELFTTAFAKASSYPSSQVDHNQKLSERLTTAYSRHHPPMLEPHLVVRFRVNALLGSATNFDPFLHLQRA